MYHLPYKSYKTPDQQDVRMAIIRGLRGQLVLPDDTASLAINADALDAVVCVLAAADFLMGHARPPDNLELAIKEGWIWVREATQSSYT